MATKQSEAWITFCPSVYQENAPYPEFHEDRRMTVRVVAPSDIFSNEELRELVRMFDPVIREFVRNKLQELNRKERDKA